MAGLNIQGEDKGHDDIPYSSLSPADEKENDIQRSYLPPVWSFVYEDKLTLIKSFILSTFALVALAYSIIKVDEVYDDFQKGEDYFIDFYLKVLLAGLIAKGLDASNSYIVSKKATERSSNLAKEIADIHFSSYYKKKKKEYHLIFSVSRGNDEKPSEIPKNAILLRKIKEDKEDHVIVYYKNEQYIKSLKLPEELVEPEKIDMKNVLKYFPNEVGEERDITQQNDRKLFNEIQSICGYDRITPQYAGKLIFDCFDVIRPALVITYDKIIYKLLETAIFPAAILIDKECDLFDVLLVAGVSSLLTLASYLYSARKIADDRNDYLEKYENLYEYISITVGHYESVKVFNAKDRLVNDIHDKMNKFETTLDQDSHGINWRASLMDIILFAVVGVGAIELSRLRDYRGDSFFYLFAYSIEQAHNIKELYEAFCKLNQANLSFDQVNRYKRMNKKGGLTYLDDEVKNNELSEKKLINFKGVNYNKIRNLNFSVNKGDKVIVEGPSGCGKSSILKLLAGLYQLDEEKGGSITLCLEEQKEWDISRFESLRKWITYVHAETQIFPYDLRNNIKIADCSASSQPKGTTDTTDDRIQDAAAKAVIGDKIDDNYEAVTLMSTGQKKRVGLARLFFKMTNILLLDEPLSGLDPETEIVFMEKLYDEIKPDIDTIISIPPSVRIREKTLAVLALLKISTLLLQRKRNENVSTYRIKKEIVQINSFELDLAQLEKTQIRLSSFPTKGQEPVQIKRDAKDLKSENSKLVDQVTALYGWANNKTELNIDAIVLIPHDRDIINEPLSGSETNALIVQEEEKGKIIVYRTNTKEKFFGLEQLKKMQRTLSSFPTEGQKEVQIKRDKDQDLVDDVAALASLANNKIDAIVLMPPDRDIMNDPLSKFGTNALIVQKGNGNSITTYRINDIEKKVFRLSKLKEKEQKKLFKFGTKGPIKIKRHEDSKLVDKIRKLSGYSNKNDKTVKDDKTVFVVEHKEGFRSYLKAKEEEEGDRIFTKAIKFHADGRITFEDDDTSSEIGAWEGVSNRNIKRGSSSSKERELKLLGELGSGSNEMEEKLGELGSGSNEMEEKYSSSSSNYSFSKGVSFSPPFSSSYSSRGHHPSIQHEDKKALAQITETRDFLISEVSLSIPASKRQSYLERLAFYEKLAKQAKLNVKDRQALDELLENIQVDHAKKVSLSNASSSSS